MSSYMIWLRNYLSKSAMFLYMFLLIMYCTTEAEQNSELYKHVFSEVIRTYVMLWKDLKSIIVFEKTLDLVRI